MRRTILVAIVIVIVFSIVGFFFYGQIKYMESCVSRMEVSSSGLPTLKQGLEGRIPVMIYNPCNFDIYIEELRYRLYVGDRLLSEGVIKDIYLPAQHNSEINIPFSIGFGGIWEALKSIFVSREVPWRLDIIAKIPVRFLSLKITDSILTITKSGTTKIEISQELERTTQEITEEVGRVIEEVKRKMKEYFAEKKTGVEVLKEYKVMWLDSSGRVIYVARPGQYVRVCIYGGPKTYTIIRIKQDLAYRPDKIVNEITLSTGIPPQGFCTFIIIEDAWGLRNYFIEVYLPSENLKYLLEPRLRIEK